MWSFELYREKLSDQSLDSFDSVYKLLNACASPYVEDEDGLDILHHAIIANYTEAVRLIFLKGWFKLHKPKCNNYLHLACYLGNVSIVTILTQERSQDYDQLSTVCYPAKCSSGHLKQNASGNQEGVNLNDKNHAHQHETGAKIAVEFAAIAGHKRCVETFFNCHKCIHSCFLECACQMNCPVSVELLLNTNQFTPKQMDAALNISLCCKQHKCLDSLLSHGAQCKDTFRGMNCYHVLFMYSFGYGDVFNRHKGFAETTKILIKHKTDVNSNKPPGTFPLYSLLHSVENVLEITDENPSTASELLQCLTLLLKDGADPNFNEQVGNNEDVLQAHGRKLFSSSLSCLFNSFSTHTMESTIVCNTFKTCCKLLLEYKAVPTLMDEERGFNAFHDACYMLAVTAFKDGHSIIKLLMKHGADPDETTLQGHFPVCIYSTALFSDTYFKEGTMKRCNDSTMKSVGVLYDFMESDKAQKAFRCTQNALEEGLGLDSKILTHGLQVCDLQFMCKVKIWKCLNRDTTLLQSINLPPSMKRAISEGMFE